MSTIAPKLATLDATLKTVKPVVCENAMPTDHTVVNLLNNYFTNYKSDLVDGPTLKFRPVPHMKDSKTELDWKSIAGKPCINLDECKSLVSYSSWCETIQKKHPEVKLSKEELKALTKSTFDGRLRGLLEIAEVAVLKPETTQEKKPRKSKKDAQPEGEQAPKAAKQPKENVFEKIVIPSLNLGFPKGHNMDDYIASIVRFLTDKDSKDRFRLRVYNFCFPHSIRKKGEPAVGTNLVYLQHISRYHDEVLKAVIEGVADADILASVQSEFADNFKPNDKLSEAERESIPLQLRNPEIVTFVLNQQMKTTDNGKQVVDFSWISQLKAIKQGPKGKGQTQTNDPISKSDIAAVRELVRELNLVNNFIKLLKTAVEDNPDDDVNECFETYNALLEEIATFGKTHKPKSNTPAAFIRLLVETAAFFGGKFKYPTKSLVKGKNGKPDREVEISYLRTFLAELKSKLPFKFSKDTRKLIDAMIMGTEPVNDANINKAADKVKEEWATIGNSGLYNVSKLDLYTKLGRIVPAALGKQYKVAVGIHVMQFIIDQLRLIKAQNSKRKSVIVYVHI